MNALYCKSCGGRTQKTSTNVKFCSHCGKPFYSAIASAPQKPAPKQKVIYQEVEEEDDFEVDYDDEEAIKARRRRARAQAGADATNITFDGDIEVIESKPRGITIGQIVAEEQSSGRTAPPPVEKRAKTHNFKSKKQIEKWFKENAGSAPRPKQ